MINITGLIEKPCPGKAGKTWRRKTVFIYQKACLLAGDLLKSILKQARP